MSAYEVHAVTSKEDANSAQRVVPTGLAGRQVSTRQRGAGEALRATANCKTSRGHSSHSETHVLAHSPELSVATVNGYESVLTPRRDGREHHTLLVVLALKKQSEGNSQRRCGCAAIPRGGRGLQAKGPAHTSGAWQLVRRTPQ